MTKLLLLNGHPAPRSVSGFLLDHYQEAAQAAGHDLRRHNLCDLDFDMDFGQGGYKDWKPLEPCLEQVLGDLEWCDHFVLGFPMWWGGQPAKLKGLFDRILIPGRAFDPRRPNWLGLPKAELKGRSARVIITSDTPGWAMRMIYRGAIRHQMRAQVMGICGIRPTRFSWCAKASDPTQTQLDRWGVQMRTHGAQGR